MLLRGPRDQWLLRGDTQLGDLQQLISDDQRAAFGTADDSYRFCAHFAYGRVLRISQHQKLKKYEAVQSPTIAIIVRFLKCVLIVPL
jgi:hypothetical protein